MARAGEIQPIQVSLRKLGTAFSLWGKVSLWIKVVLTILSGLLALVGFLPTLFTRQVPNTPATNPGTGVPANTPVTPPPVDPNTGVGLFLIACGVILLAVSAFTGLRGDTQEAAEAAPTAAEATDERTEREKRRSLNLRLVLFRHG